MALEEHGRDYVLTKVDVEPTGEAFNSIILDEQSKRPYNPMVNAGAIATTSLIKGAGATERLNRMLDVFRRYIGRDIFVDISVNQYCTEAERKHPRAKQVFRKL